MKAATGCYVAAATIGKISIHAAREGGDDDRTVIIGTNVISIHAAREGGDGHAINKCRYGNHFNPRRP